MHEPLFFVDLHPAGTYVVAVSGGLDSMALLHLLASGMAEARLIVAHFDHGIRSDSHLDRALAADAATKLGLEFVAGQGRLGHHATEDQARVARYRFLETVRAEYGAAAIVTAHHSGDRLETAIIHGLRGANGDGLLLTSRPGLLRPLLGMSKPELHRYAQHHKLAWREDTTNIDTKIARNFVRHHMLSEPQLNVSAQQAVDQLQQSTDALAETLKDWLLDHAVHSSLAVSIPAAKLKILHESELRHIYVAAARRLLPDVQFSKTALDSLVMLTKTSRGSWQKTVSSKLNVYRRYGKISLELNAGKSFVSDSLNQ